MTPGGAVAAACTGAPRHVATIEALPWVTDLLHASRSASTGQPFAEASDLAAASWATLPLLAPRDVLPTRAAVLVVVNLRDEAELAPGDAERVWLERSPSATQRAAVLRTQGPLSGSMSHSPRGYGTPAFGGRRARRGAFRVRGFPRPPWLTLSFGGGPGTAWRPPFGEELQRRNRVPSAGAERWRRPRHETPRVLERAEGLF